MNSTTNSKNDYRLAVHEAGHFVTANLCRLGISTELTIDPAAGPEPGTRVAARYVREGTEFELFLFGEIDGKPVPANAAYVSRRGLLASALIIEALSGGIAELAFGLENGAGSHYDQAKAMAIARLIFPEAEAAAAIEKISQTLLIRCRGPLRNMIETVAKRLLSSRTLDRQQCANLWEEVRPDPERVLRAWGRCATPAGSN